MDLNCFVRTRIGIQVVWAVMWVTASHLKAVTQPNAAATWVSAECGEPCMSRTSRKTSEPAVNHQWTPRCMSRTRSEPQDLLF